MTLGPGRVGPWRNRLAFGFVLVALTGCADGCGPNRVNTDDAVLVELPDAHHAIVTVTSNPGIFIGRAVTPRGAPPRATTTSPATLPDPSTMTDADITAWLGEHTGPRVITKDVPKPRAAMVGIARTLGPDAHVDSVRVTPYNQIVGHISLPDGVADPLTLHPAAVSDALHAPGTVWVGVCRRWGEGRWSRADHAFDLMHGCAGWVPAERAVSVGTLTAAGGHSPLQAPTIWLGLATVALLTVTIAGIAIRRRWWHSLVAFVVVVGTGVVACQLISLRWATDDVQEVFGTNLDIGLHDSAGRLMTWAVVLMIGGLAAAGWLAVPTVQERRRRRRTFALEPIETPTFSR